MADPVHDVSLEMEGPVSIDAHFYANRQWTYIRRKQTTCWGHFVSKHVPDAWEVPRRARVAVSEFPFGIDEFPPSYQCAELIPKLMLSASAKDELVKTIKTDLLTNQLPHDCMNDNRKSLVAGKCLKDEKVTTAINHSYDESIPVLSIGRYGVLAKRDRPADDALIAMFDSAQSTIRLAIQDLGPMQLPGTKCALPGTNWPTQYLNALARAIWQRQVEVEIILSNPSSLPGHLNGPGEFVYGNGWTCVDVATAILQAIRLQFRFSVNSKTLHDRVNKKLRICYLRSNGDTRYKCGNSIGLHGM